MRRGPVVVAGGAVLFTVVAVFGARSVLRTAPEAGDFAGSGSGSVIVEITPGASAGEIGETLRQAGVVASTRSFVQAVVARSKEGSLQPGRYRLRRGMAAASALELLLAPTSRVTRTVTVPEGLRLSEVLAVLSAKSGIPSDEFTRALARPGGLRLPSYAEGVVEGFLFPATYELHPGMTARGLLATMIDRFRQAAGDVRLERLASRRGLSPLQAVTVASIVQAEGGRDSDYPKIAQVVYNRLRRGAKLEMDSTVNYALRRHTLKVSVQDTKVESPYNTYAHPGLPPAPIGNPGESALRAALQPAKGDWFWFVTTDPQRKITKFTDKETEFRKYREELNRYLGTN
ncbi:endolytic transglycosylase MltG [Sphaerimonospora sp. CA-214678]|uniref:endolytic transglycosylase MltG n=1 Tax=Sphaerimonospora sp. CA-214678 TaxID=3240029 RepID=UPI003D90C53A